MGLLVEDAKSGGQSIQDTGMQGQEKTDAPVPEGREYMTFFFSVLSSFLADCMMLPHIT